MKAWLDRSLSALLGDEPKQRQILRNTLAGSLVCVVCCLIQWVGVHTGFVPAVEGYALIGMILGGQVFFYAAIRSGWTRRFTDPAMTMVQMVFTFLCIGAAYHINPPIRGILLVLVAPVLTFGAFSLSPRRCRQLGGVGFVILASTMILGAILRPADFPPPIEAVAFTCIAVAMPVMGFLSGQLSQMQRDLRAQRHELNDALKRVNAMAIRDELTGLPNRRHMRERAEHEVQRVRRGNGSLCVGVLDLDHFKTVNDQLGHSAGDAVLMNFALQAQSVLRETDILARWGGEEFLLLCPDTTIDQALQILERVRSHLHRPESWSTTPVERVTFSAGLADHEPTANFEQTLGRADDALYKAKALGRDRCIVA